MNRDCAICGKEFSFGKSREKTAKYCSRECSAKGHFRPRNTRCIVCGVLVYRKPNELAKSKVGITCSMKCSGTLRKSIFRGKDNPNYKESRVGSDGYLISTSEFDGEIKEPKLHREVYRRELGIESIPVGIHIHHRDCNPRNNDPENLVGLTPSDHKWLHKQYGNATLWAMCNDLVSINDAITWSDDQDRARRLLTLNSIVQGIYIREFGVSIETMLVSSGPIIATLEEIE
jgi:hypothetical protein